jgi:hypothetical protein
VPSAVRGTVSLGRVKLGIANGLSRTGPSSGASSAGVPQLRRIDQLIDEAALRPDASR